MRAAIVCILATAHGFVAPARRPCHPRRDVAPRAAKETTWDRITGPKLFKSVKRTEGGRRRPTGRGVATTPPQRRGPEPVRRARHSPSKHRTISSTRRSDAAVTTGRRLGADRRARCHSRARYVARAGTIRGSRRHPRGAARAAARADGYSDGPPRQRGRILAGARPSFEGLARRRRASRPRRRRRQTSARRALMVSSTSSSSPTSGFCRATRSSGRRSTTTSSSGAARCWRSAS